MVEIPPYPEKRESRYSKAYDLLPFKSRFWHLLHSASKPLMRNGIDYIYNNCYHEIYERKLQEGWINPEIALLHTHLGELMLKDFPRDPSKWKNNKIETEEKYLDKKHLELQQKDARLWYEFRAILCCLLDEDSFYMIRFLYLLELLFRDQEKYHIEMHKKHAYWNWEEELIKLQAHDRKWVEWEAKKAHDELKDSL